MSIDYISFENEHVLYADRMNITGTYGSTSISNGALIVNGGVGIASDLYTGNSIHTKDLYADSITYNDVYHIVSTNDATSTSTGAMIVAGGAGIAKSLYVGNLLNVLNTDESTSSTTGSMMTSGGVGINKSLYAKLNVSAGNDIRAYKGPDYTYINRGASDTLIASSTADNSLVIDATIPEVNIMSTNDATDTLTGSLFITGGVNIIGNEFNQGKINILNTTNALSTYTGALVVSGGASVGQNFYTGGDVVASGDVYGSTYYVSSTDNSTSTSTGALVIIGGGGIAGNLYVGGNVNAPTMVTNQIYCDGTVGSTSISTGALRVSGGVAITSQSYMTGELDLRRSTDSNHSFITGYNPAMSSSNDICFFRGGCDATNAANGISMMFHYQGSGSGVNGTYLQYNGSNTPHRFLQTALQVPKELRVYNDAAVTMYTTLTVDSSGKSTIYSAGGTHSVASGTLFRVLNTTTSTSITTGALVVSGGVGIGGTTYIGGGIVAGNSASACSFTFNTSLLQGVHNIFNPSMAASTTVMSCVGKAGTNCNSGITRYTHLADGSATNYVDFGMYGTAGATGGIRCLGDGTCSVISQTDTTSISSGSLVINGGLGIAKNAFIGARLTASTMTCSTAPTNATDVARLADIPSSTSTPQFLRVGIGNAPSTTCPLLIQSAHTSSVYDISLPYSYDAIATRQGILSGINGLYLHADGSVNLGSLTDETTFCSHVKSFVSPTASNDVVRLSDIGGSVSSKTSFTIKWTGLWNTDYTQTLTLYKNPMGIVSAYFALNSSASESMISTTYAHLSNTTLIPSGYRPLTETEIQFRLFYDGSYIFGSLVAYADGTCSLFNGPSRGNFTTGKVMTLTPSNVMVWATS